MARIHRQDIKTGKRQRYRSRWRQGSQWLHEPTSRNRSNPLPFYLFPFSLVNDYTDKWYAQSPRDVSDATNPNTVQTVEQPLSKKEGQKLTEEQNQVIQ